MSQKEPTPANAAPAASAVASQKGGRPPKNEDEKQTIVIKVRVTKKEYESLKKRAESEGKTLVKTLLSKPYSASEPKWKKAETRIWAGMANNLNQLAWKANAQGFGAAEKEVLDLLQQIKKELDKSK